MGFLSVLSMAHKLVGERVSPGDTVVDATCGNGVDTTFLARLVGPRGLVYGFDIQPEALERTRVRLEDGIRANRAPADAASTAGTDAGRAMPDLGSADKQPVKLVLASHADMALHVDGSVRGRTAAVMFNLGYLPGADPSVITQPQSTVAALESALSLLRPGGIVTAVVYPGHAGGDLEADAVLRWASELPAPAGQAVLYRMAQKPESPFLIAVEKK